MNIIIILALSFVAGRIAVEIYRSKKGDNHECKKWKRKIWPNKIH